MTAQPTGECLGGDIRLDDIPLDKLEGLSTAALDLSARRLAVSERRHGAYLVAHLVEIARRRAHVELGCSSLADYCMRKLGLSEGQVWVRIQVAGKCGEFPQLLAALLEDRINITVAGLLCPHLESFNVAELIADCQGRTRREAEDYLVAVGLKERPLVTAGIRRRSVAPAAQAQTS